MESGEKQSIPSEVNSEDLMTRMQIEEQYVWIHGNPPLEDQSSSYIISSNVVQSRTNFGTSEEECMERSSSTHDLLPALLETEYENQWITTNHGKRKYSKPHCLKIVNRGVYSIEKREIGKVQEPKNKLPTMKFHDSTTAVLEMLINNNYVDQFYEMIGTGKNSVVFHASWSSKNRMCVPTAVAVKIYKTSKDEEKNKIVYKQVQREFEHMEMLKHIKPWPPWRRYNPDVVRAWKNVIIMSLIGFHRRTPTIADVSNEKDKEIYKCAIEYIANCYKIANLVHGNLSARKILFWFERPFFIGWSQSVKRSHPLALAKLLKDCHFVTEFYKRRGVHVVSTIDVFKQISGLDVIDDKLLATIEPKNLYDKYETNPNRITRPVKPSTHNRFK